MKRWKKGLIWTLSVVVVLGVGGLFAANYAVDKLMNSMAGGFDVEAGNTPSVPQGQVIEPVVADSDPSAEPAASADPASSAAPASTPASGNAASTDKPVSAGKPASTPAPTPVDGLAHISTDKAKEVQENVTITDKANVAAIVAKQLSVSDIKRLQELAQGGLTTEEKREARSIILGKVSEEQYNELAQIAKKYGVSQGKTRDQILAEEEKLKAQEKGSE
ncbi:hypothetical protein C162_21558 [Paenibacillus sp. FSL R7-269]|uniref:hypothetical protein n=1 Tax=Paenibacillus sp. FSL R7-269 TaxID=1226755 RepID=UPI0003E20E3B|nr:hypothetical protein [Paenibacillus sp. FSL R7-269]ETT45167.1 hypothetical protein C162_21558 [Paenibacillus sp. FSL R7-269]